MIVVDASVWVDYFNGTPTAEADALDAILDQERIVVGDLTLTEVLSGFRRDSDFRRAKELLDTCEYRHMVGREVAVEAASNYRVLCKRGATVRKTLDVLIGTFCILNDLPLLHRDRDFDPLEQHLGLRVWRKERSSR
jgi:predicted nucleic acid-binding protein